MDLLERRSIYYWAAKGKKQDAQCNTSLVPRLNVMVTVAVF